MSLGRLTLATGGIASPGWRRRWSGGLALAGLALFAGCLVFNGKVAEDDGGGADDASSEGPRDGGAGFCATQRGAELLLCLDFDDADSPSAVFGDASLSTSGGGTLALDGNEGGPPPPSLPHALDVSLPGNDGGAGAGAMVAFGPLTKGIECMLDALYDTEPTQTGNDAPGELLDIQLTAQDVSGGPLHVQLQGQRAFVTGFAADGGGSIYNFESLDFTWTRATWVAVDIRVTFQPPSLFLSLDGVSTWLSSPPAIPNLGVIGGGNVLLGAEVQTAGPALEYHLDNVRCWAL